MFENEIKYKSDEELLILTFLYKYGLSSTYLHKNFKCTRSEDTSLYEYYDDIQIINNAHYAKHQINKIKRKDYSCMEIEYIKDRRITVTVHNYSIGLSGIAKLEVLNIKDRCVEYEDDNIRPLPIFLKQKDGTFRAINLNEFEYLENVLQKYNNFNGPEYFDDSSHYDTEKEMEEARLLRESFEKEKINRGFDYLYYDSNFYRCTSVKVIALYKEEVKELEKYSIENKESILDKYYWDIREMLQEERAIRIEEELAKIEAKIDYIF